MGTAAKFMDGTEISLTCWRDWYDGPVSGLAQWGGRDVWFRPTSDAGEETRTYEIFDLVPEQVAGCLTWFEEKREWFETRAPQIRKIRRDVTDTAEQECPIAAQGLSLREWNGPEISSCAIARFADDQVRASWFDAERWCPLQDEPSPT
ncbi:hypothetical protein [uncultured Hyphomonas sp.]|uniref:hypothetical protein n=1 Tax=uncultured Hyphomonas sp. TaxID=225298 RepID=UPI002AAA7C2C|nr:hypothetical protein [uncultured Hyphomonas sp.]